MKKLLVSSAAVAALVLPLFASALTNYGTLSENVGIGKTLSVGLNSLPSGSWIVSSNSNPSIADVSLTASSVLLKGKSAGSTLVFVCDSTGSGCMQVNLNVGSVLGSYITAHANGTFVLGTDGQTVFYVTGSGLIPIPTWKIFLSVGGKASKIVPANDADMNMAMLPLMESKDSRVQ